MGVRGRSGRKPNGVDPITGHGPLWRKRLVQVVRGDSGLDIDAIAERFGITAAQSREWRAEAMRT